MQNSRADTLSQNSTVSGWFHSNREPLGQDTQLACLAHMNYGGGCTKTKQNLAKTKYTKRAIVAVRLLLLRHSPSYSDSLTHE
jgi:hypothetical protein